MKMVLAIAAGGAIGALARHFLSGWLLRLTGAGFPWPILIINGVGSMAMGALVAWAALKGEWSIETRAFLTVGILGGFTTFSTFALDASSLIERGLNFQAGAYIFLSVLLAVGGFILAKALIEALL